MVVEGVSYDVNWKGFRPGKSIFIPCLNPKKAREEILTVTDRLRLKVLFKVTIEDNVRGLRVWRVRV